MSTLPTPDQESPVFNKFPIVGVGASAGGLEAFLELFKALHPSTGMGFVLVTHLEPHHKSQLTEILASATSLSVAEAENGLRVEPDHVYILPPNAEMIIRQGALQLSARSESLNPHYPIDRFFESLAKDQGSSAIGIILSGGGSDGAQGLRAIKGKGGTTFCQDSQSAKHRSMPHAAVGTGAVDFVLPAAQIAAELQKLRFQPYLSHSSEAVNAEDLHAEDMDAEDQEVGPRQDQAQFGRILSLLRNTHAVDFNQYKANTVNRRIGRRMLINHLTSLADYVRMLETHPTEIDDLYRDLLISVTSFFREPAMFEVFRERVAKSLEDRKPNEPFRIWVAGCATGEESYSFAIVLTEIFEAAFKRIPLQVFSTDISDDAIDRARSGVYADSIQHDVSPERLRKFFARVDSGYRVADSIRQCCIFARHNLIADPAFSHLDVITCRNVLIYLGSAVQERVLRSLHYGLNPGGILVLGSAETIGERSDLFVTIDQEHKIFSKKAATVRVGLDLGPTEGRIAEMLDLGLPLGGQASAEIDLEGRAARVLRDLYTPAGVIVNGDMQVLHFHGPTNFYLEPAQGEASLSLMRLARPSLLYPLRAALDQAKRTKAPVAESRVHVEHNGENREITLRVLPLDDELPSYLVLFEEGERAGAEDRTLRPAAARPDQEAGAAEHQIAQANREISQMRDYLRKVTEQYEAATEELRAANEESRSANEEMQSTNEELRTAKEELQSSNEELTTVNDELKHRNEELRLSNNDLTNVLGAATIPILMVGMDLCLRRFTPAAERLLGLAASDIGQPIAALQHGFQVLNVNEKLRHAIEHLEIHHERVQDRRGRWYEVFVRPYRTMDDRIEGAVLAFIDIDDLVRALQTAETARTFAEAIVDTVQHPLLVLDANLRIIQATDAFYKMFRIAPKEAEGQLLDEVGVGQWRLPELRNLLDAALVRDVPFRDLDIEHEYPNIGRRIMRLNARRITSQDNHPHRLLLAIEDVTDRKETAELQYRRLFESARDAILILDAQSGNVVDANPFFTELTRYQRQEVVGKRFTDLEVFLESEEARGLVEATRLNGMASYDSVRIRARDGKLLVLAIASNRYRLMEQDFIQINIRDVTESRKIEQRLRSSNLDLQQFAFAASHDLQEPLRTVTTFSQLIKLQLKGKLSEETDQHLDFIAAAADRMSQMVLDLLGYSQVVRAETNPVSVSVEAVLSSVMLNLQLAIRDSGARVSFDHLPTVKMDQTLLTQLLQNLIGNAIKYRSAARPEIHMAARDGGSEWVFSVKDNGIGLDPKYAEHIFTVFKRLHGSEYPGTGIGLAICKRIVERHGGHIWAESQQGQGSTFYFTVLKHPHLDD